MGLDTGFEMGIYQNLRVVIIVALGSCPSSKDPFVAVGTSLAVAHRVPLILVLGALPTSLFWQSRATC